MTEVASLALVTGPTDFRTLLKSIAKHAEDAEAKNDEAFMRAILDARIFLSRNLASDSALYEIYLINLLECIVAKGDVRENEAKRPSDVELAARGIKELLQPLAKLLQEAEKNSKVELTPEVATLFRDAWYNCAIHGFIYGSKLVDELREYFLVIARNSPSLVSDTRGYQIESEMELNTVLRRGMNPPNTVEHKKRLSSLLVRNDAEIKGLTYPTVVFLEAACTLETLRAITGTCTKVLTYFVDPTLKVGNSAACMVSISSFVRNIYPHTI
jgi:phosphatidylinositol 4-kinase A